MGTIVATEGDTIRLTGTAPSSLAGVAVAMDVSLYGVERQFSGTVTDASGGEWQCVVSTPDDALAVGLWRARVKYTRSGEVESDERFFLEIEARP